MQFLDILIEVSNKGERMKKITLILAFVSVSAFAGATNVAGKPIIGLQSGFGASKVSAQPGSNVGAGFNAGNAKQKTMSDLLYNAPKSKGDGLK